MRAWARKAVLFAGGVLLSVLWGSSLDAGDCPSLSFVRVDVDTVELRVPCQGLILSDMTFNFAKGDCSGLEGNCPIEVSP
jgi:hypothetical protein